MVIENCRIVLVRPRVPENVGATARVMRNFGLCELVLVNPEADLQDRQARKLSTHGETILDEARIVSTLADAVGDCVLVAGTSARSAGRIRGATLGCPGEIAVLLAHASAGGKVAIVFGPEQNGLTNAEAGICHHLICIPTAPDCPALNLAQAVAICAYELSKSCRGLTPTRQPPGIVGGERNHSDFARENRMFEHLREGLDAIGFLHGADADSLFIAVRQMLARSAPSAVEIDILHGLARQMQWLAKQRTK